jgi:hypothetical protein
MLSNDRFGRLADIDGRGPERQLWAHVGQPEMIEGSGNWRIGAFKD